MPKKNPLQRKTCVSRFTAQVINPAYRIKCSGDRTKSNSNRSILFGNRTRSNSHKNFLNLTKSNIRLLNGRQSNLRLFQLIIKVDYDYFCVSYFRRQEMQSERNRTGFGSIVFDLLEKRTHTKLDVRFDSVRSPNAIEHESFDRLFSCTHFTFEVVIKFRPNSRLHLLLTGKQTRQNLPTIIIWIEPSTKFDFVWNHVVSLHEVQPRCWWDADRSDFGSGDFFPSQKDFDLFLYINLGTDSYFIYTNLCKIGKK